MNEESPDLETAPSDEEESITEHETLTLMGCGCISLIFLMFTGGCFHVDLHDKFRIDGERHSESGRFVPNVGINMHHSELTLPFIIIDQYEFPYDIAIYLYDETAVDSDEGLSHFYITKLVIQFEDEARKEYTQDNYDRFKSRFSFKNNSNAYLPDLVDLKKSYSLELRGFSVDSSGTKFPFELQTHVNHSKAFDFYPIMWKWMSV